MKCESCSSTQRTKKLKERVLVQVKSEATGDNFFNISGQELVPLLGDTIVNFSTDKDQIIKKVMTLRNIVVIVQSDNMLKVVDPSSDEEGVEGVVALIKE